MYVLQDLAESKSLKSVTHISIEVQDIQDQPPVFQNAPFTATVMENSVTVCIYVNLCFSGNICSYFVIYFRTFALNLSLRFVFIFSQGTSVLNLAARDGDGGAPRDLILFIENGNFF